ARFSNRIGTAVLDNADLPPIILQYAKPGDRMMVWGWDCALYLHTDLIRGSRYWYPQFLYERYPEEFRKRAADRYEKDIWHYRPMVIVELFRDDWRHGPAMEAYPSIQKLVNKNYVLVASNERYKIFTLRE